MERSVCIALVAIIITFAVTSSASPPEPEALALPSALPRDGDVLFKGSDDGLWGALARLASRRDDGFGHVGIVIARDDGFAVIHANGRPGDPKGAVHETRLNRFLADADQYALYRPNLDVAARARMTDYAEREAAAATPFDSLFSLDTDEAMYCTELVWRALNAALAHDSVPRKSTYGALVYIALDDLQDAPVLHLVHTQARQE